MTDTLEGAALLLFRQLRSDLPGLFIQIDPHNPHVEISVEILRQAGLDFDVLEAYPDMPEWISRTDVFVALAGVHLVGAVGCVLARAGARAIGYVVIGAYASLGFYGLAHYTLAAYSRHTAMMNVTILFEVLTAAVLLVIVVIQSRTS